MSLHKSCCVTGHRDIPEQKIGEVRELLGQEIQRAIQDGYKNFLFGGADGADLIFAEQVLAFRDKGEEITLEADIPYRNRLKTPNLAFQSVIARCNAIGIVRGEYQKSCFHERNRDMVQKSSRVIAVYDGRESGGTAYTVCYARAMNREVRIVFP